MYKTPGGYERHRVAKHSRSESEASLRVFSSSLLEEIVPGAIRSINASEVFAESLRSELNNYKYQPLLEGTHEFCVLKTLYDGFLKNGNLEKFYSKYYATVPMKSTRFFRGLSRNAATLLSTKVADSIVAFCKKQREKPEKTNSISPLKEREIAGLQYLGGYVLHKLHKKHARASSRESQQAMAVLKAGKVDHTSDSHQKLVSSLNRGGLWSVTGPAQKIFLKTEGWFRQLTPNVDLKGLDLAGITHKAISESDILANFNLMVTDADIKPDSHVSKEVLYGIVKLYVQVRAFSVAKDVIQKYKIQTKQTKAKSLRKEICRSQSDQQPRQE